MSCPYKASDPKDLSDKLYRTNYSSQRIKYLFSCFTFFVLRISKLSIFFLNLVFCIYIAINFLPKVTIITTDKKNAKKTKYIHKKAIPFSM